MGLKQGSESARISILVSAVMFVVSALTAFFWHNEKGFDASTSIAVACAIVYAAFLILSSWVLACCRRSERQANVRNIYMYIQGKGDRPEAPSVEYKMPKH